MTCPACGALGGAGDERCVACGHRFAGGETPGEEPTAVVAVGDSVPEAAEDDVEVVLRPRQASSPASSNGGGPAGTAQLREAGKSAPTELPGVSPRRPGLVIDFDDLTDVPGAPTAAPLPPERPALPAPAVVPEPAWAPPPGPAPAPPAPWQPVTATMPAVVPPTGPPAPPALGPSGSDGVPPWKRPIVLGPAAALLVVLLGVGGWMLFGRGSQDERTAGSVLQAAQTRVTDLSGRAGRATKLVTIRQVGREAGTAAKDLQGREETASTIEDVKLREQTLTLLRAQQAYLAGLGGLSEVQQRDLLRSQMPAWSSTKSQLQQATAAMRTAQTPIVALELPGEVNVDVSAVAQATETVDKTIRSAGYQLREWRKELAVYTRAVERAKRKSAAIVAYRDRVRGAISSYEDDREDVDEFVADIDDYDFSKSADYRAARDRVLGFQNQRQSTLATLQELGVQAPASAQTEHEALAEPVFRSLDGLSNLFDAVEEAWYAEEPARDMPSWAEFEALGGDIDAKLEGSKKSWESRVEGLRVQALTEGVPPRPKRPNV